MMKGSVRQVILVIATIWSLFLCTTTVGFAPSISNPRNPSFAAPPRTTTTTKTTSTTCRWIVVDPNALIAPAAASILAGQQVVQRSSDLADKEAKAEKDLSNVQSDLRNANTFTTSFVAALSATAISLAVLIFGTDTSVAPQAPPMMPPPMMPPPMTMPYQPATPYYPYYQQQVPALPMQPTLPGQRQQAPPITEPEVRALFQKWNSALKTLDSDTVARRYAKNAVLLPTKSNVPRADYASIKDYFDSFLKGQPTGEILESYVRIGDDWCKDVGIYEFTLGTNGNKIRGRYSFVYIFEDGDWKILHHHSSVMPEPVVA